MSEPTLHPSLAELAVGDTVADRRTGRIIGQVDSFARDSGNRHAIVSWPAEDMPHARTDERGRRAQAFNLASLQRVSEPDAWFTGWYCGCTLFTATQDAARGACPTHGVEPIAAPSPVFGNDRPLGLQPGEPWGPLARLDGTGPGAQCGTSDCAGVASWIPISEGNAGSRVYRCRECCDRIAASVTA